jgi:nickel-dependent lactate racemase
MHADLAYGKKRLNVNFPDDWKVSIVEPKYLEGLKEPADAVRAALIEPIGTPPLRQLVSSHHHVGIVINDITRATPTQLILQPILDILLEIVPQDQITLFIALGTHRENKESELRGILGETIFGYFPVVQNNAFDQATQKHLGKTQRGHQIWINRQFAECDFHIVTGFIEPHFFAGFSGGGKAIMPGMAGLETIMSNHSARMLADPGATWGVTKGNPTWEEMQEIAGLFNPFVVNVAMNRDKSITRVFAGDLKQAHEFGCTYAKLHAMAPVPEPFDIVVTSNSGYPLDLNLYQSVKGMSAAAKIVKNGGDIIMAAECWDGIPEHGQFASLLRSADSPGELLNSILEPGFRLHDQWQVQILLQILHKADVFVYSENLTAEMLESCFLHATDDIETTIQSLANKHLGNPSVCLLPEGPLTIPYLE